MKDKKVENFNYKIRIIKSIARVSYENVVKLLVIKEFDTLNFHFLITLKTTKNVSITEI